MNENIIEVRNLSKKFANHQAVKNISFDLKRGEIKGILGANGAGKTTTITMLLGLLTPTSGSIKILSHDISKNRYKILNKINFSSPYVDLPKKLTVRQNLFVYGMLYGVANINKKIKSIAKELGFENLLDPEILFLDEPTASLDPDTADRIRTFFENFCKKHNTAIILASHNMEEVTRLCDSVIMMKNGEITDQGSPSSLLKKYGKKKLEDVFLKIARGEGNR
ncbi:MAG: ATP-binding cassette domain-containing protein [Candidatus Fonsibacter ubiquis]|nr:ATP-binding cassette domain-containing protein [Candidatus Fonsibacter ubiquis]